MKKTALTTRRFLLKTCATGLAAASAAQPQGAPRKEPGQTKIVLIVGHDAMHNDVGYEVYIRSIFSSKPDFRIWAARTNRVLTPDLISDADLVVTQRFGDPYEWDEDGLADSLGRDVRTLYNDVMAPAIIDNVRSRGMGWLALHNAVWNGRPDLEQFLGVEAELHQELQPVIYKDFNQDHPITRGIEPFVVNIEEQFGVKVIRPPETTILFRSLAVHDGRDSVAGWCLERGNGRVVGLLPGHLEWPYRVEAYREVFWRAVLWAMKRPLEPYPRRDVPQLW